MDISRPDLTQVPSDVRTYIEILEAELRELRPKRKKRRAFTSRSVAAEAPPPPSFDPTEPPTTMNVITLSRQGIVKRTPRHIYTRQRRGGTGVFGLDLAKKDTPTLLTVADIEDTLLLISNFARAYHLPVSRLPEDEINGRGASLSNLILLDRGERIAIMLPTPTQGHLFLVNKTGEVRRFRHGLFRDGMRKGLLLYSTVEFGSPLAGCIALDEKDILIATQQGRAIRFPEEKVPTRPCQGIRLKGNDRIAGITAVDDESQVFLLGADGKGTLRLMSGFRANKTPGAQGKMAMKNDQLMAAMSVQDSQDIFVISATGKLIRFPTTEIPATEGTVQGVHCISLRADEAVSMTVG